MESRNFHFGYQTYKKKFKNNSRRILEKLRIFVYNVLCNIVSIRKENT